MSNLNEKELPEFIQELRNLLGSIQGCNGRLNETLSLSYVVVVDTEEQKSAVEQIGNVLSQQAAKYAIDLEVTPAMPEEIKEAREALLQIQLKEKGSFEV